jgi:peptidoglycan/xylan/chitin deacetylase (PgdA/CDA1 family)
MTPIAEAVPVHNADASWRGKLRRRYARLRRRRKLCGRPARPIVSFTFDDVPESAAVAGAGALEARGWRGTFYISAGLFGREGPMGRYAGSEDVRRLARAGHEIGCHTYSHLECGPAAPDRIAREVEINAAALAELCGGPPRTFAYPFGDVSCEAKTELAPRFRLLRALHPGLARQGTDLNLTPAVPIDGPEGESRGALWIERAARRRSWLILCLHDVADDRSFWGCTPEALARLIARAEARGCDILPVAEALDRLEAVAPTRGTP